MGGEARAKAPTSPRNLDLKAVSCDTLAVTYFPSLNCLLPMFLAIPVPSALYKQKDERSNLKQVERRPTKRVIRYSTSKLPGLLQSVVCQQLCPHYLAMLGTTFLGTFDATLAGLHSYLSCTPTENAIWLISSQSDI